MVGYEGLAKAPEREATPLISLGMRRVLLRSCSFALSLYHSGAPVYPYLRIVIPKARTTVAALVQNHGRTGSIDRSPRFATTGALNLLQYSLSSSTGKSSTSTRPSTSCIPHYVITNVLSLSGSLPSFSLVVTPEKQLSSMFAVLIVSV